MGLRDSEFLLLACAGFACDFRAGAVGKRGDDLRSAPDRWLYAASCAAQFTSFSCSYQPVLEQQTPGSSTSLLTMYIGALPLAALRRSPVPLRPSPYAPSQVSVSTRKGNVWRSRTVEDATLGLVQS